MLYQRIEPSIIQVLPKAVFKGMLDELDQNPAFLKALIEISFERQRHYMKEFLSRIKDTPLQGYTNLIKERPHIVKRVPQHYIASYLGIISAANLRSVDLQLSGSGLGSWTKSQVRTLFTGILPEMFQLAASGKLRIGTVNVALRDIEKLWNMDVPDGRRLVVQV